MKPINTAALANNSHPLDKIEKGVVSSRPFNRTLRGIKSTLQMVLLRVATLVLVFFLMYIVALISVHVTGQGH